MVLKRLAYTYTALMTFFILIEFWLVFSVSVFAAVLRSMFNLSISSMTSEGRNTWATLIVFARERY